MNQGPNNRRPSSRRRSDLARRNESNRFNSRKDSNVREQYESRDNRFRSAGSSDGGGGSGGIKINSNSIAILAGVLVIGVGIGSLITSTTSGGQGNIASQQQLDMAVPDPDFCRQYGASAFVIDIEMYTTLNPSTSFVTQPALQQGCVTKLVEGFKVVYISTSITKALAPYCLQKSGSGTAISNCC